jgi:hypothetical protein
VAPEDADFTDEFCQFLQSAVPAVEAAEFLVLLQGEPARACTPPEGAARYVAGLQASGLVDVDSEQRVRYKPASEALAAHVATLEKLWRERPVTLIRVIYGLRDSKIRSFADAFRLRRK